MMTIPDTRLMRDPLERVLCSIWKIKLFSRHARLTHWERLARLELMEAIAQLSDRPRSADILIATPTIVLTGDLK